MNRIHKFIMAGLAGLLLLTGGATAQGQHAHRHGMAPAAPDTVAAMPPQASACPMAQAMKPMDFASNVMCYIPQRDMFVAVDSIDCAVDIITRNEQGSFDTARYTTDVYKRRHDIVNILRPVSVGVIGERVIFIASAAKDSSYIGFLDFEGNLTNRIGLNCTSYAFQINPSKHELIVVGKNQLGYDMRFVDLGDQPGCINEKFDHLTDANVTSYHYHVPKQSDRIKAADPVGIGLTVVAVAVVFLALLCISLIIKGYGGAIMKIQDRKAKKVAPVSKSNTGVANPSATAGEVYAAISAAIYLYDEEMHDEEDTIITIQKVERAWTPWNAKFYNMNQFFNKR